MCVTLATNKNMEGGAWSAAYLGNSQYCSALGLRAAGASRVEGRRQQMEGADLVVEFGGAEELQRKEVGGAQPRTQPARRPDRDG